MTFSLVARCSKTGMFGVAISSSSPAVASRCAYTRSGVGAVASQNITDPTLGPKTLDYIQKGIDDVVFLNIKYPNKNSWFIKYFQFWKLMEAIFFIFLVRTHLTISELF